MANRMAKKEVINITVERFDELTLAEAQVADLKKEVKKLQGQVALLKAKK